MTYDEKNYANAVILLIKHFGYTRNYGAGNHEVLP